MTEWRLFDPSSPPAWTTPEWYANRDRAFHLEEPNHRERLLRTAEIINILNPDIVVDLGAGDGGLLSQVKAASAWGYDLQDSNILGAREREVEVWKLDVVEDLSFVEATMARDRRDFLPIGARAFAVVTEILEHLIDPHAYLRRLLRDTTFDVIVASSPVNENRTHHYEYHTWAWNEAGYVKMFLDAGWQVFTHEIVFPHQIVVASR